MRWAGLFMVVAILLAGIVLVRGATAFDGLSLLALVFVILSLIAWLFSWLATRAVERGRSR